MSFILDALRKSEHERQRQAGPSVAELPIARPASRSQIALAVIAALLLVNLAVVLYFLLRGEGKPAAAPPPAGAVAAAPAAPAPTARASALTGPVAPPAAPAPIRPPAATVARPAPPGREVRPLAEVAGTANAARPSQAAPGTPDPSLLPPLPAPRPAAAPQRASAAPAGGFIPRLDSLPAEATAGLPKLNLDLHIYSPDPAQRAVFINGQRYHEGDTVPGGARIEAITTEGAVLRYRGQRFLLPRQ